MRFLTFAIAVFTATLAMAVPLGRQSKRTSKLQFFGVNESGPEFGTNIPGVKNTDYVWPNLSTIDTFISKGMNTFRVNFLMERLVPNTMTGSMDAAYLADLTTTVDYITNKGAYAVIVPHNYGRYYGNVFTDTTAFGTFWKTIATPFKNNSKVIFDTNNEFHDESSTVVAALNQAAVTAIRSIGATTQYITLEGNAWTGAWTWTTTAGTDGLTNAVAMVNITDTVPDRLMYQMHQYLDSDGSGTSATCVSSTIGQERLVAATKWLKDNGKLGFLGEYAGGDNDVCKTAVKGMLEYMDENDDVWVGAAWWAAGPWWGDYIYSMEPTSGVAYTAYLDTIMAYA